MEKRYSNVFTVIALCVSITSFFFNAFPQLKPQNDDYLARANAGDLKAQIYLADYYYKIADYPQSIYWYKIAAARESSYRGQIINNMTCAYLRCDLLDSSLYDYHDKIVQMFQMAYGLGDELALKNVYTFLYRTPEFLFNEINRDEMLESVEFMLREVEDYQELFNRGAAYTWIIDREEERTIESRRWLIRGGFEYIPNDHMKDERYYVASVTRCRTLGITSYECDVVIEVYKQVEVAPANYFYHEDII